MRQVEIEINGNDYKLLTFGAKKCIKLVTKVSKILNGNLNLDGQEGIASMLLGMLAEDDILDLIIELTETVTFGTGSKKIDFDMHFSEHQKDLLPLVTFSLSENVIPFFDPTALAAIMEKLAESAQDYLGE